MNNSFLASNFDATFKTAATTSTIIFIISGIISIAIFSFVIFSIVKTIKAAKSGELVNETMIQENSVDTNEFATCKYCGSSNKKENTSCENCGANLKHK